MSGLALDAERCRLGDCLDVDVDFIPPGGTKLKGLLRYELCLYHYV